MAIDRIRASASEVLPSPRIAHDQAYLLRPRLLALHASLRRAARFQHLWASSRELAPLFYFHKPRQADYDASRADATAFPADVAWNAVDSGVRDLWPALVADADVRQSARAIAGLYAAAQELASIHPAARDLSDLLRVLDDEVLCVVEPATRAGFTMEVRGVEVIDQLHDLLDGHTCYQVLALSGLRQDGSLPTGAGSSAHWLFNDQPAAMLPRIDGERVVLLGEPLPLFRRTDERRFPGLSVEARRLRTLTLPEVLERLSKWAGAPLPQSAPARQASARAA